MKRTAGLTALALAFSVGGLSTQAAAQTGPASPAPKPSANHRSGTVTLITGDKVTLRYDQAGKPVARIEPAGNRAVQFSTVLHKGALTVIPSDAEPLIASGLLDKRLFDVTQLLAFGYGDAERGDIPVITESAKGATPTLKAAQQAEPIPALGFTSSRVPKNKAAELWKDLAGTGAQAKTMAGGVEKLWLDGKRQFNLDKSVEQIKATTAWTQGLTGKGITVAVLDSGYDANHPDLKGVVTQARNFSDQTTDTRDNIGHGTHVATTIAGSGAASTGKYKGVAPDAKLAIGKIGDFFITDSAILAGLDWAANHVKAKVVNMSFGGPDTPDIDPIEQAVNTLSTTTGTLFVVAAGNSGPQSIGSPGSADEALTVGAVDKNNTLAGFSSTGPRDHDKGLKPDVTAPGVGITAAAAEGTATSPYTAMSGTSMATPHVVGAAAILAQRHPTWTGRQLKAALTGSAVKQGTNTPFEQGAGRIDVSRAITQSVTADPGTLSAELPWPHSDTQQTTKTLTYTNHGTAPATLDLAVENSGGALPAGLITLSTPQVQVPAGGTAPVTVTIAAKGAATGAYSAVITATAGDTTVRTPIGAHIAPETHEVTVKVIGRDGQAPAERVSAYAYNVASGKFTDIPVTAGTGTVRLPLGDWFVRALIPSQQASTLAHAPLKVAAGAEPVVLDARQGNPIRFSLDRPDATPDQVLSQIVVHRQGQASFEFGNVVFDADPNASGYVIPSRLPGVDYLASTVWHKQGAPISPYRYDLALHHTGGLPDNPAYHGKTAALVKVTSKYHAPGVAGEAQLLVGAAPGDGAMLFGGTRVSLPSTLTQYRTPSRALTWYSRVIHGNEYEVFDSGTVLKGRTHRETWGAAVAGPAADRYGSMRYQNEMWVSASSLFTDPVAGRTSFDLKTSGTISLSLDGRELGRQDFPHCEGPAPCELAVTVPESAGTYTATATVKRDVPRTALSTAVESTWTFPSARTADFTTLPLLSVRYAPKGLNNFNQAKAGTAVRIPLQVETPAGTPKPNVQAITVEASTDDGTTWTKVELHRTHKGWKVHIPATLTGNFVSLRATVDAGDTKVTQTIKRAYALIP
ncbi:Serine protease, subtilisin family [Sinosporangium album]|uniref:Serine protease, subtilisin family n=1 Tax=Sinosporangium album TaxID=504805 RepID=A0A1G7SA29_9ACTN|nr:S8 family serine peptidase [Sinosporangium album]SDG19896.1 Serine protease, subtilisin family [Sinosporangium album]